MASFVERLKKSVKLPTMKATQEFIDIDKERERLWGELDKKREESRRIELEALKAQELASDLSKAAGKEERRQQAEAAKLAVKAALQKRRELDELEFRSKKIAEQYDDEARRVFHATQKLFEQQYQDKKIIEAETDLRKQRLNFEAAEKERALNVERLKAEADLEVKRHKEELEAELKEKQEKIDQDKAEATSQASAGIKEKAKKSEEASTASLVIPAKSIPTKGLRKSKSLKNSAPIRAQKPIDRLQGAASASKFFNTRPSARIKPQTISDLPPPRASSQVFNLGGGIGTGFNVEQLSGAGTKGAKMGFVGSGKDVTLTAPTGGVESGRAYQIGVLVGVAQYSAEENEQVNFGLEGVYVFEASEAISVGDSVNYVSDRIALTGGFAIGKALNDAQSGEAVRVKLEQARA